MVQKFKQKVHRGDENPDGTEKVDSRPIETPLHIMRPLSMAERIRQMVQGELSRRAEAQGHESFEEADDFDVGDDYDPSSPYEVNFDQQLAPAYDARREEDKPPVTEEPPAKAKSKNNKNKIIEESPRKNSESDEE